MSSMYERCMKVMPPAAGRSTKLGIVSAKGCYLTAEDGKEYLDFASGVAVCNMAIITQRLWRQPKNRWIR